MFVLKAEFSGHTACLAPDNCAGEDGTFLAQQENLLVPDERMVLFLALLVLVTLVNNTISE